MVYWSAKEAAYQLPRKRFQQNPGFDNDPDVWTFRYYTSRLVDGQEKRVRTQVTLGPKKGPQRLTASEAERKKQQFLLKHDREEITPTGAMTVEAYYEGPYQSHLAATSKNHRVQMASLMTNHILPAIGQRTLKGLSRTHIQNLINSKAHADVDGNLLSPQTLRHLRKHISAVWLHAKSEGVVEGDNPAAKIKLPARRLVNRTPALKELEAAWILRRLVEKRRPLYAAMATLSLCCSTNVAEMCGIRWKRLNLTEGEIRPEGKILPPGSVWICEDWTQNEYHATKTDYRERVLPLPAVLIQFLQRWRYETKFRRDDHPVFAARTGSPIDYNNANNRVFKSLQHGLDVAFTWNSFRHTFKALADRLGIASRTKKVMMGHSLQSDISDQYGETDFAEMRSLVERIAQSIGAEEALNGNLDEIENGRIISIR